MITALSPGPLPGLDFLSFSLLQAKPKIGCRFLFVGLYWMALVFPGPVVGSCLWGQSSGAQVGCRRQAGGAVLTPQGRSSAGCQSSASGPLAFPAATSLQLELDLERETPELGPLLRLPVPSHP